MVDRTGVKISAQDSWQPRGTACVREAQLDKVSPCGTALLPADTRKNLREWWLAEGGSRSQTPNWDIASTCTIFGRKGLLLVEAKAHTGELPPTDRCGATSARNRERIKCAIEEANAGLQRVTGDSWCLSADDCYQVCNRFAWSWKLASLNVPVALVYLGFLDAFEVNDLGNPFRSDAAWRGALRKYCRNVIDVSCWGRILDVHGTPMLPLMRTRLQPYELL